MLASGTDRDPSEVLGVRVRGLELGLGFIKHLDDDRVDPFILRIYLQFPIVRF